MFCGKCEAKNPDDAKFCLECGAKLNRVETEKVETPIVTEPNYKNRKVGIIAVAALAVIVIVVASSLFGGRSYETTVEKFFNAMLNADAETIFELVPEKMIDDILKEDGYDVDELDVLIDEMNKNLNRSFKEIEEDLGMGWKMTYEIRRVKDIESYDLDNLKECYKIYDVKISSAKTINILVTLEGNEFRDSNVIDINVIKIGRSWYLDFESIFGMND